jgi:hypothetical protein
MSYPHSPDFHDPYQVSPQPPRHAAGAARGDLSSNRFPQPSAPSGPQTGPTFAGYADSQRQPPPAAPPRPFPPDPAEARPHATARYAAPAPRLQTWPNFGDELFRLAHDGSKLFVDRDLINKGLSCAVLAELGVTKRVAVDEQDRLILIDDRPPPDALAHTVLAQVVSEPEPLHVHEWLRYLSADVYEQVARRMILSGDLLKVTRKRLVGSRTSYTPTDNNTAYWTCARLNIDVRNGNPLRPFDRILVGLLLSTGVHRRVFDGPSSQVVEQLTAYSRQSQPPVPALLGALDSLVGNGVLSRT